MKYKDGLTKSPFYRDFSGGINIRETAHAINDNECRTAKNCHFLGKGINKRAGWTKLATAAVGTANALTGVFQGSWVSGGVVTRKVLATDGITVFWLNSTTWTDITGALTLTAPATAVVSFVQMNNLVIGYDGTNAPWKWDGATAAIAALGGSPPTGNIAIVWMNRLFWAGVGTAQTRLYYSEIGDPENNPAANYLDVPSAYDGDPITGLSILYGNLIIFKRNSIYILTGDAPSNFVLSKTNSSVGCVSPYSIAPVGNLVYFVSDKGLYAMNLTNNRQVSYKYEPTYNLAVQNQLAGSFTKNRLMALHYRKLNQIWVLMDGSAAGQDHHDRVAVHDYNTVDANGDPAVSEYWTATSVETSPAVVGDYITSAGSIMPMASFYDKYVWTHTGTADGNNNFSMSYVTKWFDFGDSFAYKTMRNIFTTGVFASGLPKFGMDISDDIGVSSSGATYQPGAGVSWWNIKAKFPGSAIAQQKARFFRITFTSDDGGNFQLYEFGFELIWKGRLA